MRRQTQPSAWSCFPTAVAMILDVPVQCVFDYLGHDGSEILWPEYSEPDCRRGFSHQEIVDYILHEHGRRATDIYLAPTSGLICGETVEPPIHTKWRSWNERFQYYLDHYYGVLFNIDHAVAWDCERIYDPRGPMYSLESGIFQPDSMLIF